MLLFLLSSSLYPQNIKHPACIIENQNPVYFTGIERQLTAYFNSTDDPPGSIPGLMTFWDYVTNGNNLRRIWVRGDTVIVAADWVDSLNFETTSARRTLYQVSYNGGMSWLPAPVQLTALGSCYPDISIIKYLGKKTVFISGREYTPTLIGYVCLDSLLGMHHLLVNPVPYVGRDYYSSKLSDSIIAGCYNSSDSLWYLDYNYLRNTFDSRQLLARSPDFIASYSRYYISASDNAHNVFVMWWFTDNDSAKMYGRESTNGGISFTNQFIVFPDRVNINNDIVSPSVGADVLYKPGTSIKCAAVNTNRSSTFNKAQSAKIIFWSPGINGGLPVNIADWTNIPIIHDTAAFNSHTSYIQTGMGPVSHPSLAFSDNGSVLFCVFSVVQDDTTWYSYRFNDIWCSYSVNNGLTWTTPFSLTNTDAQDEIYPTISKTGNTVQGNTATIHVTYLQSDSPGSASFMDVTPPSRNYHIYTKYQFSIVGMKTAGNGIPKCYSLKQNFPNPFNPTTSICFYLPKRSFVNITVYNILGEEVKKLVNGYFNAGSYSLDWDGSDFPSGVYFYRLETDGFSVSKKMILLK